MFPGMRTKSRKPRFIPWLEFLEKREALDATLRFSTQQITVSPFLIFPSFRRKRNFTAPFRTIGFNSKNKLPRPSEGKYPLPVGRGVGDGKDRNISGLDFDGEGQLQTRYLTGPGMDQWFARIGAGEDTEWYLTDRLGSVRRIVDASGNALDDLVYDSFGDILSESNPVKGARFKFTGREYSSELDIYYYRARWYDPATGQFISPDPIGFQAGDANLYRYVGNGPLDATDPEGQQPINEWRLDINGHGGPHIQKGNQRWGAKTLKPLPGTIYPLTKKDNKEPKKPETSKGLLRMLTVLWLKKLLKKQLTRAKSLAGKISPKRQ